MDERTTAELKAGKGVQVAAFLAGAVHFPMRMSRHWPFSPVSWRRVGLPGCWLLLLATAAPLRADDWISAQPLDAVSPNSRWEARTILGTADAFNPPVGQRGEFAKAIVRDRETGEATTFALECPVSPVEIRLLDDGSLLTFDNWHQLGYQQVVSRYARRGKLLWSHTLEDLLTTEQIQHVPHSVSSRHWRRQPLEAEIAAAADGRRWLALTLWNEDRVRIALDDGTVRYTPVAALGDDPERLLRRAQARRDEGAREEAVRLLRQALALDPHLLEAYRQLAWTYQELDDPAQAVTVLQTATRLHPALPKPPPKTDTETAGTAQGPSNDPRMWLLHELARALERAARPAEAEATYQEVLRLDPEAWNAASELARLWLEQGRLAEGQRLLEEHFAILRGSADHFMAQSNLQHAALEVGRVYSGAGDHLRARDVLLRAYDPAAPVPGFGENVALDLATTMERLGETTQAIVVLERLRAQFVAAVNPAFHTHWITLVDDALARLRATGR